MLDTAVPDIIKGGAAMPVRRLALLHYTQGASAKSSISYWREVGLSAHFIVDRDGTIYQCRPCNIQCAHAGVSRWRDPKTGKLYKNINNISIGIEIANAGDSLGVIAWAKKNCGAATVKLKHQNGGPVVEWEKFPNKQLQSVFDLAKACVDRYRLDDLSSHDHVSPERKRDVGPAFPLNRIRDYCGFGDTMPVIHWT